MNLAQALQMLLWCTLSVCLLLLARLKIQIPLFFVEMDTFLWNRLISETGIR